MVEMCQQVLPFGGCACSTNVAQWNHNKPCLAVTPPATAKPFPTLVISNTLLYHMFTYGHINLSQNKLHLSITSAIFASWSTPWDGPWLALLPCCLMAATGRQMSSKAKINALLASSPIIQLNAPRDWISGSSCGAFKAVGKIAHLLSEAKFERRLEKIGQLRLLLLNFKWIIFGISEERH